MASELETKKAAAQKKNAANMLFQQLKNNNDGLNRIFAFFGGRDVLVDIVGSETEIKAVEDAQTALSTLCQNLVK